MSNLSEEEKKAIDILENVIADEVIGTYCTEFAVPKYNCNLCVDKNGKPDDCYYEKAIDIVLNLIEKQQVEINKEKEKNNNILGLVFECGQIDGEHHKTWVIDQIVRILTENDYDKWVQHYEYDEATGEEYTWDIGIAP